MENDNNLTNWNPSSFWSSHSMMDQSDPFESALSSMVSSPVASHADRGDFMITQFIGRLGSFSSFGSHELSLSEAEQLAYGSMVKAETGELSRASSFKSMRSQMGCVGKSVEGFENGELGDSREGSSVSEQIPNASNQSKKRKGGPKGKAKEASLSASVKNGKDVTDENQNCKRSKTDEASGNGKKGQKSNKESNDKTSKDSSEVVEPPKDYIHVRARRGQATDSHSLAERVRREKISERMKFLQDLVPGCNKVTGKAVMLDEIINYVQSLQHQVEFLSMKLATVNPRMDLHMEALLSKEILQSQGALQNALYQLDSAASASFPFGYQPHQLPPLHSHNISNETDTHFPVNLNASSLIQNPTMQSPAFDRFGGAHSQQFLEDDLQSMLQMGFGQIEQHGLHGSVASAQMKIEH